jgi:hypothetical protein
MNAESRPKAAPTDAANVAGHSTVSSRHSDGGDDPRKDERLRMPPPDPILDRIDRHLSPADDDLSLADAIRRYQELQEHAGHG